MKTLIIVFISLGIFLPNTILASPYCAGYTYDTLECKYDTYINCLRATPGKAGICIVNPIEKIIVRGMGIYCVTTVTTIKRCDYYNKHECEVIAKEKHGACLRN